MSLITHIPCEATATALIHSTHVHSVSPTDHCQPVAAWSLDADQWQGSTSCCIYKWSVLSTVTPLTSGQCCPLSHHSPVVSAVHCHTTHQWSVLSTVTPLTSGQCCPLSHHSPVVSAVHCHTTHQWSVLSTVTPLTSGQCCPLSHHSPVVSAIHRVARLTQALTTFIKPELYFPELSAPLHTAVSSTTACHVTAWLQHKGSS